MRKTEKERRNDSRYGQRRQKKKKKSTGLFRGGRTQEPSFPLLHEVLVSKNVMRIALVTNKQTKKNYQVVKRTLI